MEAKEGGNISLPYRHDLIDQAKRLRRDMTRQEKHLWYDFLKTHPVRFQRQKTIGSYIVDFYCHSAKLAVELDGSQHFEAAAEQYDARRTAVLASQGIEVLRVANIDVDQNFPGVCAIIDRRVEARVNSLSHLR